MIQGYRAYERGVTSLIVVLFSTLLFVVVAVGFMQTMTTEQRASADDELSRGAYDSALAGVEDGKRVLQACLNGDASICTKINNQKCTTVSDAGYVTAQSNGEVYLQSNSSSGPTGKEYQQAYTCVKINPNTKDYTGKVMANNDSVVIPLRMTGPISKLTVSWFTSADSTDRTKINLDNILNTSTNLSTEGAWPTDMPSILRLQLIQFKDGNLDSTSFDGDGNGHTIYLYPKQYDSLPTFSNDIRRIGTLQPQAVKCETLFLKYYACSAEVDLPNPIGGDATNRVAYLRVSSFYRDTNFSVEPVDNSVKFDGVQPAIDSTGRAADVFRRVEARVELNDPDDKMLYPRATVDTTSSFCKAFGISDDPGDYRDYCD